jgi:hypothetical protein
MDGVLDWMIGFIDTLYTQLGTTGSYSAIACLHTFSSPLHTHYGSVFTSRILATDLSQSHWHIKSHMKSSFHSWTPFLPLLCSFQSRRLDSIQFQAHIPAGWLPETRLFTLDYYSIQSIISWPVVCRIILQDTHIHLHISSLEIVAVGHYASLPTLV